MPSPPESTGGKPNVPPAVAPIRALVVDDEPFARQELSHLLEGIDDIDIVGEAENGVQAVELLGSLQPQLVFLDIQMPGLDGFQVVQEIHRRRLPVHVIFVTAYDQYALRAFEVSATDYLLKPVNLRRLERAVDRVRSEIGRVDLGSPRLEALLSALGRDRYQTRIPVRRDDRVGLIDVADMIYAHISEGCVYAVTDSGSELTGYRTLEELESDLDPAIFVRVHRSYLANLGKVQEIIPWFSGTFHLKMTGAEDEEIPVSRAQARRLRKLLKW